jgi:hypothetical protein
MRYFLTPEEREKIKEQMNPKGSNHKDCNFFKILEELPEGFKVEVGYWITYIGCRPKYSKEVIFFKK